MREREEVRCWVSGGSEGTGRSEEGFAGTHKVVPVSVVLLVVLVLEHLHALSVLHRQQRPRGNLLLDALDDIVLPSVQEDARAGADVGDLRASLAGHDARALHVRLAEGNQVVALLVCVKVLEQEDAGICVQHLRGDAEREEGGHGDEKGPWR